MRTIVINNCYKEMFTTLQNCCSKDESRYFLMNIYYNGKGTFVSTNGKWMCVYDMKDTEMHKKLGEEEGYFTYAKDMLIEMERSDWHFPQWERIIPKSKAHTETIEVDRKIAKANRGAHLLSHLVFLTGHRLSGDLHPVLKELTGKWTVGWDNESCNSITMKSGAFQLIIMPMAK